MHQTFFCVLMHTVTSGAASNLQSVQFVQKGCIFIFYSKEILEFIHAELKNTPPLNIISWQWYIRTFPSPAFSTSERYEGRSNN